MNVSLLAFTQLSPGLDASSPIRQGVGTSEEGLIEFAGRVCYRSDAQMGRSPGFISARVREGHEDIVEHVRLVFGVEGAPLDETLLLLASQPTVYFTRLGEEDWVWSMNARNIRDFWKRSESPLAAAMVRLANAVVPAVYADLAGLWQEVEA